MKNSIVISIFVLSVSLWFYWNSRSQVAAVNAPVVSQATTVATATPPTEAVKEAAKPVASLSDEKTVEEAIGYWVFKTAHQQYEAKHMYQFYISKVADPQLHGGRQIEGILFSYDDVNPSKQTLGKLELDKIQDGIAHFKVIEKDVSVFYDNGYYNNESLVRTFVINLNGTPSILAKSDNAETILSGTPEKIDASKVLSALKGKWKGSRTFDNAKVTLGLQGLNDFINDYGTVKVSGDCSADAKFKVRPIDESLFLISTGSASCEIGSNAFKGMIKDGQMKSVLYRQHSEATELAMDQN